jgi:hypothetical protein
MRIKDSGLVSLFFCLVTVAPVCRAQLSAVPEAAIETLGTTPGIPQSNGFVFIEGRYIAPPYTVIRKGNGIFINRVQVEQPFAWAALSVMPATTAPAPKRGDDANKGEAEKEKPLPDVRAIEGAGAESSEAPVGNTLDALFDEKPASPATEAKQGGTPEKKAAAVILTQTQKDELRQKLDMRRLRFETGLGQGEIFLFNEKFGRLNGTYGTARALFAVLPEALRYATSPQDLMARLNQGGVNFLDINACSDLYRNKLSFMTLSARRRAIENAEEKKAQLRQR